MENHSIKVALVGNPNTGKSSIFNILTGLHQKTGNYPGVTVEKKEGSFKLSDTLDAKIYDFPGLYSLNANSYDEHLVLNVLSDNSNEFYPDVVVFTCDIENLQRNLLLFTQIRDLNIPIVLAINMYDMADKKGISIDIHTLETRLQTKIVLLSVLKNKGFDELKKIIVDYKNLDKTPCLNISRLIDTPIDDTQSQYHQWINFTKNYNKSESESARLMYKEAALRGQYIRNALDGTYEKNPIKDKSLQGKLDRLLIHPIFGYLFFFCILAIIFQAIYSWCSYPMDLIDSSFSSLGSWVSSVLPKGMFTNLITEGIISGISGIVIFIPQIACLFIFISILEESGYMSRVIYLMDRWVSKFGLSGKSVVPLISGTACAIPAIMASRHIESWKERLIIILVSPFTTCSARLPVYLIIIAIIIPSTTVLGFSLQGLTLLALYILGFTAALVASYILNKILKIKSEKSLIIEMPSYRIPLIKNIGITVFDKVKDFLFSAGKIILAISIILWFLASHGPGTYLENAEEIVSTQIENKTLGAADLNIKISAYKLEHSYIGILGKSIEPVISPLGYDWKIGIAIITSLAAREVFVGTLATIYSVEDDDDKTIKEKMQNDINPKTNKPVFNIATGISLLLFYAFAMQCISTLAIVKRETNSWKWPILQFVGMTTIAYISALVAFQTIKSFI